MAFVAADFAEQLEVAPLPLLCSPLSLAFNGLVCCAQKLSDAETTELAINVLSKKWGETVRKSLVRSHVTRWRSDPLFGGSYSYIRVGASGADMDVLQAPHTAHIQFAGEHTNRGYPGTVHGAHDSGKREARTLRRTLHKTFGVPLSS